MPIDYQRDDHRRLIIVTLTDPFSFDELLVQTDRQSTEQTWKYAILYDGRAIAHVTPAPGLQRLPDRSYSVGGGHPRDPVGVAIPRRPEMVRRELQDHRICSSVCEERTIYIRRPTEAATRRAPLRSDQSVQLLLIRGALVVLADAEYRCAVLHADRCLP